MAYALRSTLFSLRGLREFSRQAHWSKRRKFAAEDLRVDLSNQRCVVTGANQGIGFATAQALALRGAHVLMISRSLERGEAARQQIASSANSHSISLKVCDMGSLSDVRRLAKELLADGPLHALVNNAGCLLHECILTEEGIEKNFATNTCGPFLLTELLLQHTRRIIFVSSGGAYTETLSDAVKDMMFISGTFNGTAQYARNKRQQIALCEHWAQQNIQSLDVCASMHPGMYPWTISLLLKLHILACSCYSCFEVAQVGSIQKRCSRRSQASENSCLADCARLKRAQTPWYGCAAHQPRRYGMVAFTLIASLKRRICYSAGSMRRKTCASWYRSSDASLKWGKQRLAHDCFIR